MARRSLKASAEGIQKARHAYNRYGFTQQALAEEVNLKTRQPIGNFFAGKNVERHVFIEICTALDLNWEEIVEREADANTGEINSDIDTLVQDLRDRGRADIQSRCGTMRMLDMTQPIDTNSIYTNVNILEKVAGKTHAEIDQMMQGCSPENFDRISLGNVCEEGVDGLKAVAHHKLLMILGLPGAGKTTFLKRLAILCNLGERFVDRVPIFITLKEFADKPDKPSLLNFIGNVETIQQILCAGRGLVLLDGLDEVQEAEHDWILTEIRGLDFAIDNGQNIIVITSRFAAQEHIFEKFTEVQIADFNPAQIKDFVTKWPWIKGPNQAELFIKKLEMTGKPIQELATNPLLLSLLCSIFDDSGCFPSKKLSIYEQGVAQLLRKWNSSKRKIDSIYKKLSPDYLEELLSQIASSTFESGKYFFKPNEVKTQIRDFFRELISKEDFLQLDSHKILQSFELQNGLLIERASGVYSFSHLTFHEYFAAKHLIERTDRETMLFQLLERSAEKSWREVFLLVVEQLKPADALLKGLKKKIDDMLLEDKFQEYLTWVLKKSSSVSTIYKSRAVRAYYYSLALALACVRDNTLSLPCSLPEALEPDTRFYLYSDLALDRELAIGLADTYAPEPDFSSIVITVYTDDPCNSYVLARDRAKSLSFGLDICLQFDKGVKWNQQIQQLRTILLKNHKKFDTWWETNRQTWSNQLRQVMIFHCNIGHDWKFTEGQKQKLQQYYEANKLLVDCLNSECSVSLSVREEIEETLFLPIAEIEKWKREHRS